MAKFPVTESVFVCETGLEGDQQADLKNHGGIDKAVHHYPHDHYAFWQSHIPNNPPALQNPGAFGENISTYDMTEGTVFLGDIYQVGNAVLQVSQARQPCWKLNARFDHKSMAMDIQKTRKTGWYYRVLEQGDIRQGDHITLMDRPHEDWPLTRLMNIIYDKSKDRDDLIAMADLELLAESWRSLAEKRLKSNHIEDWKSRLGQ